VIIKDTNFGLGTLFSDLYGSLVGVPIEVVLKNECYYFTVRQAMTALRNTNKSVKKWRKFPRKMWWQIPQLNCRDCVEKQIVPPPMIHSEMYCFLMLSFLYSLR